MRRPSHSVRAYLATIAVSVTLVAVYVLITALP